MDSEGFDYALPSNMEGAMEELKQMDKIPFRNDYSKENCDLRRKWVEHFSKTNLPHISKWWGKKEDNPEILKGNIELPIGTVSIPLAVAGPLLIDGCNAKGHFLAPLATTEGALVASINRGALALSKCGGVITTATQQRMGRGPAIKTMSPAEAYKLGEWIKNHLDIIQEEVVCKYSRHAVLKDIIPVYDLEYVHLLFRYETGDAAGQNATTITTWNILPWVHENAPKDIRIVKSWIEANISGDKKSVNLHAVLGRGLSVSATAIVTEDVLSKTLHTSSESLVEFVRVGSRMSARTNMGGSNVCVSNVLAAIFAACGQDIASVVESSWSNLNIDKHEGPGGGVKLSIHMPSLVIGTVGGGTDLPTQAECLKIMGCHGTGKVRKLGEIIAAFCMAMELSTFSAISAGEFATAHDNLGRNKPKHKL